MHGNKYQRRRHSRAHSPTPIVPYRGGTLRYIMELIIKMPKEDYEGLKNFDSLAKDKQKWLINRTLNRIMDGTPLPKGHNRLFDEKDIVNGNYEIIGNRIYELEPILEADSGPSGQPQAADKTETLYCDRNICISNEYNGIGCDECICRTTEGGCQ